MSDPREKLQAMFKEENRYANFGPALAHIHVQGFRCHSTTPVEFQSPITALCGLNGTGKSTILQLAAAAYRPPSGAKRFYVRDFIVAGKLDINPFTVDASVRYQYLREIPKVLMRRPQVVTVSRNLSKWTGYKRQPVRHVFFAGMGLYLPRVEQRDFVVRNAGKITINDTTPITTSSKETICKILSCSYDQINANNVSYQNQKRKVITVARSGNNYSEANMGCGEGRVQHIIRVMETLPEMSLILLEEPETSLHPSAQTEFARFLLENCAEKRHQIILTTHSEFILQTLPPASRIFLHRTPTGIDLIPGLTASQAKSMMAGGHVKALDVLVEDQCAKHILNELIRRIDPNFLKSIAIHPFGDENLVGKTVAKLQEIGIPIAAVRDADKKGNPSQNIFKLPGSQPPEKEVFANADVDKYILSTYEIRLKDFMATMRKIDHHDWFSRLADELSLEESPLTCELARIYARSIPESEAFSLTNQLKAAIKK